MKHKNLNIFSDGSIRTLVLLSILSVLLLLFFQYQSLQNSYAISQQETKNSLTATLETAILKYQKLKADSLKNMLKKLIKSERDFKFKMVVDNAYPDITFSTHSYSKYFFNGPSYKEHKLHLPPSSFKKTDIQTNPYGVFLQIINEAEYNTLISIGLRVLPERSYPENSTEYKIENRIIAICSSPYGDEQAFNSILNKHLQKNNSPYKAKISVYKHPAQIWARKNSSIFEIPFEQQLEQLQLWLKAKNSKDSVFIAKPLLYNDVTLINKDVPTLLLSASVTTSQTLAQMRYSIAGTLILLVILIVLLGYMIKLIVNQKQLAEIKNDFIANISHELQTPITTSLTAIQGLQYYEILNDTEKTQQYLATASTELKKMSALVTKILDSALYDKGQFSLSAKPFNLKNTLADLLPLIQVKGNNQQITYSYEGEEMVHADQLHIQQSIANLLDNALKYSAAQSPVYLHVVRTSSTLSIRVKDSGNGIPKAFQHHIFDKFFRVPQPNDHRIKGHGLGLHYAKSIAQAHGGDLVLVQSDKTGSTFLFTLPQ